MVSLSSINRSPLASPPMYMGCCDHIASTIMMYADIPSSRGCVREDLHRTTVAIKEVFASKCFIPTYPIKDCATITAPEEITATYDNDILDCYWQIDSTGELPYGTPNLVFSTEPLTENFTLVTGLSRSALAEELGERAERIIPGLSYHPLSSYNLVHYLRYMPSLRVTIAERITGVLGFGTEADVFETQTGSDVGALKVGKKLTRLQEPKKYAFTLQKCLKQLSVIKQVPAHPHILAFKSLTFAPSLGAWGVAFEKIQGTTLSKWLAQPHTDDEIANVLIGHIKGMQHLDRANWPFCDVHLSNFMVREPKQEGVVIDWVGDPETSDRSSAASHEARVSWCIFLLGYHSLPTQISAVLTEAARRDVSMDTLGWEEMIRRLSSSATTTRPPSAS